MALRFQRRIRVLPGVHLNLSRSGVGLSVGGRGAHLGITARGQRYTSVGAPGTGLSWREYQNPAPQQTGHRPAADPSGPAARSCELCDEPNHLHIPGALVIVVVVALGILLIAALSGR